MPTKNQLSKMRESEIEYPQIRREPIDVKQPNTMTYDEQRISDQIDGGLLEQKRQELLQSAKDEAARERGCASWADFKLLNRAFGAVTKKDEDLDFILNRAMEIYAERGNIKWTPKNDFQPVDGKWYWAIIPKEDGSGWYNPQTARYNNGEYYVWTTKNDVPHLMPMPKFTHIAEIIYPQTTKP